MTPQERAFRRAVYAYYRQHKRALPWRPPSLGLRKDGSANPYRVLVSEFMLQQTQVERVRGAYEAFINKFPTAATLAQASPREVIAAWQGLGYNRRALALQRSCIDIVATHAGVVPSECDALLALPGVGPSTAGAVRAFAYNKPALFIETNIRRAYIHHFFKDAQGVRDGALLELLERTLDAKRPREWYYALMDYGSALAKHVPNPNRRSAHYTRQSAFVGSNRQIRGEVLRLLLAKSLSWGQLQKRLNVERARLEAIVASLAAEGFIERVGTRLSLRDARPSKYVVK